MKMKKIYALLILSCFAKVSFAQCGFTITPQVLANVSCNGLANGAVSASVTGGTGPFTFNWKLNGNNIGANDTLTGLAAGTYWVIVTDQAGPCTDSVSVNLNQPTPLIANINQVTPAYCGNASGSICVNGMGGTPGYVYSIMGGAFNGVNCFQGLFPGTYTVVVMDAQGCQATNIIPINFVPGPVASISSTPAHCGACDGTATVNVSGGSAPYTYSWGGGNPTTQQVSTGLCAQTTYTCTVVDANGCTATDLVTIQSTTNGGNMYTTVVPSACGQSNGSIVIDSLYGLWPPFTFTLSPLGGTTGTPAFYNLIGGTYQLLVSDSAGCQVNKMIVVNDSSFAIQLNPTMPTCNMCDGSIATTIVGGTAPYYYNWSNGASTSTASNMCAGNYFVEVTDTNGCYAATSVALIPPSSPVIHIGNITPATCSNPGSVQATVTGGVGAITYLWQPSLNTTPNPMLASGSHTLTVTDANGCTSSQIVYVPNAVNIYVYWTQINSPNCLLNNGSIKVVGFGGLAPYTYSWSNGATTDSIYGLSAGNYNVTVTDANGCSGQGQFHLITQCLNVVKGRVYDDVNQNCIQDPGEAGLSGKIVATSNWNTGYTDVNGDYMIQTTETSTTLTVYNYSQYYTPTCPVNGSSAISFSQAGDTLNNVNFGYFADPNYFDLSMHPGWTPGHPGFQKTYWIYFANQSVAPQNAIVRFVYDPILQFDSANAGGVHNLTQHKIEWTYNNLPTNKGWDWFNDPRAYFTVPVSTPLTASLHSYFEIVPIVGDGHPADNTLDITEPITGSRDPNEKSVIPKGEGPTGAILREDSTLFYTIHFQNNGNDTAYTVIVRDTLSEFLDPSTIIPGASNHEYTFSLSGQGVMTWTFNHIMLPDSLTNEQESNGYFNYTVKQKQNNPFGSQIKNTAYIYFDFNDAVVTNTTLNTVAPSIGINELKMSGIGLLLYPNPASSEVMVQYEVKEKADVQLELYSLMGAVVRSKTLHNAHKGNNLESIDVRDVASGIYFVKVSCGNDQSFQKLIITK